MIVNWPHAMRCRARPLCAITAAQLQLSSLLESWAEPEVEAGPQHIYAGPDAEGSGRGSETAGSAGKDVRRAAESVVVVFDKTAQPIQEGVFAADPNRPATAMLGRRARDGSHNEKIVAAGFLGAASLDVSEKMVPGMAEAPGH